MKRLIVLLCIVGVLSISGCAIGSNLNPELLDEYFTNCSCDKCTCEGIISEDCTCVNCICFEKEHEKCPCKEKGDFDCTCSTCSCEN